MLNRIRKFAQNAAESVSEIFREYPVLKSHVAIFSLHSVQLFIGEVEDKNRQLHKGVSFQLPRQGWPVNRAAVLSQTDALRFIEFLARLEALELPCSFVFSREHEDLEWKVLRLREKWHGGGGLVGYLHGNWLADHSNPPKVVMTRDAVSSLKICIEERYVLAT